MKIAVVSQYFWPEPFAINDLVLALAEQGHTVDVLTGKPNYPDGQLYSGYQENGYFSEEMAAGVTIYRVPMRARRKGGAVNLVLNYISFVWNGWWGFPRLVKDKQYDAIFAVNLSPITAVIPAIRLSRKLKVPMFIWVLDVWPDSLQAMGYVKNPVALHAIGSTLVKWIYSKAERVLIQSKAFTEPVGKYAGREKLIEFASCARDFLPSSTDPVAIPPSLLHTLNQDFCVVFTGNLGRAQALDILLDAAEKMREITDFKLILVGSGSMSAWLLEQITQRELDGVILAGRYPPEVMPQFLSRAKALVATLSPEPIFSQTVPAKIQTYMAAGKPILASLDGEGARVIRHAGAGLISDAGDAEQLAQNFRRLYDLSDLEREQLGQAGRDYFLENFESHAQAKKLSELLKLRTSK